jgi:hypothetical protein
MNNVKYDVTRNISGAEIMVILNNFCSLLVKPGLANDQNCWLINGNIVANPSIAEASHLNSDHFSGWYRFKHSTSQGSNLIIKNSNTELIFISQGIDTIIQAKISNPVRANNSSV